MSRSFRRTRLVGLISVFVAGLCLAASPAQTPDGEKGDGADFFGLLRGVKHGGIVYSRGPDFKLTCDIYVPAGTGPFPTILAMHGGAWQGGSKVHLLRHAIRFCNAGFVVVSVNYRHAPDHQFPAQVQDGFAALDFVGERAAEFQIDTDQVFGFGYSAGGHLIALLATTEPEDWFRGADALPDHCPRIRAAAVGGTPCDFEWLAADSAVLKYWMGATKAEDPARYRHASPACRVSRNSPPFWLFHGSDDLIVPSTCADRMAQALQEQGVVCTVTKLPGCGHLEAFLQLEMVNKAIDFFREQTDAGWNIRQQR
jgi:acetyl esterase/lipase